jgi:hypothetical protein
MTEVFRELLALECWLLSSRPFLTTVKHSKKVDSVFLHAIDNQVLRARHD